MENAEIQQVVEDLEVQIERLRSLYQQYFMGIEKLQPSILRKNVDRAIWTLRRERLQNTRLRFKFQQIIQRYNTYEQYWRRILRDIERGTYVRDVARVAKRFGKDGVMTVAGRAGAELLHKIDGDAPDAAAWEIDEDDAPTPPSHRVELPAPPEPEPPPTAHATPAPVERRPPPPPPRRAAPSQQQITPAPIPAPSPAPAPAPAPFVPPRGPLPPPPGALRPPPGAVPPAPRASAPIAAKPAAPAPSATAATTDDAGKRAVFEAYVTGRRKNGEPVDNVTYEKVAQSLERQAAQLRQKHGTSRKVEFEVVTKDGRTMIRPVVK